VIGMNNQPASNRPFDESLFDLLLQQFSGSDGELPMAIAYLTQATTDDNALRKSTLVRIAKEKIKHANIVGSMLLKMAHGTSGPLSTHLDEGELRELLAQQGGHHKNLDRARVLLGKFSKAKAPSDPERHYASDPKVYLQANIVTEDKQIAAYEEMASLTTEGNFISALNYAKARQLQHREELVGLLQQVSE
jgi:Mn-containing catalase